MDDAAPDLPTRRGRPPGQPMAVAARQLGHHHFSFVRAAVQLPEQLRDAWLRYLAFEGGPDDERHFGARLHELTGRIRQSAAARGLQALAEIALPRHATGRRAPAERPAWPSLADWVRERCEALGIDEDYQSQADWLAEYRIEFALDSPARPAHALRAAAEAPSPAGPPLHTRLEALNALAGALARAPAATDTLAAWLTPDVTRRLAQTAVAGRAMPLLTIANLLAFVGLFHHRWWRHVPRLGAVRAQRLMAWLEPIAQALGQPLPALAMQPLHRITLAREGALARLAPGAGAQFGLVPLGRLAVPPALSGREGVFRSRQPNTLGADEDLQAIFAWLQRHRHSARTHAAYARIVERFYLWCLLVRRKPMSSLDEGDYHAYRDFLARPPADWVQERRVARATSEWRPFKGALGARSRRLDMTVIAGMLAALADAGYLTANAARGVLPSMKLPQQRIDIDRSLDDAQWSLVLDGWRSLYAECGPAAGSCEDRFPARAASLRRVRLVLELGSTMGLRLIELVTTRRGAVARALVAGRPVWVVQVLGKGARLREVPMRDDVKALLDQHHEDMRRAGTAFDPENPRRRELQPGPPTALPFAGDAAGAPGAELAQLPLVGALRTAPPRWRADERGVAVLDRSAPGNHDRHGSLDPTALYQSLKRFFLRCSVMARAQGREADAVRLARASTHWLRHFFANTAAADGVDLSALKEALGHASLQTTSVYVRAERARLVGELGKMRRRG